MLAVISPSPPATKVDLYNETLEVLEAMMSEGNDAWVAKGTVSVCSLISAIKEDASLRRQIVLDFDNCVETLTRWDSYSAFPQISSSSTQIYRVLPFMQRIEVPV